MPWEELAAQIAKQIEGHWCSWEKDRGYIVWKVGTVHRDRSGKRIWLEAGRTSFEYLELIVSGISDEEWKSRLAALVRPMVDFVADRLWCVPQE